MNESIYNHNAKLKVSGFPIGTAEGEKSSGHQEVKAKFISLLSKG